MNGWWRLWIFSSVVWLIALAFFAYQNYSPIRNIDEREVISALTSDAAQYFQEWSPEYQELSYTSSFIFTDGTQSTIRFPLLSESELDDIERRLRALSDRENKVVSESEMLRFVALVKAENEKASRAMQQFERLSNEKIAEERDRHDRFIANMLALFIAFPAGSLLLGAGLGWVFRGFKRT
jgi:hypothetical protein